MSCPHCGGPVEIDQSDAGKWRTPNGLFHLNGRCASCRRKSGGDANRYGLFWRHVADPSAPFADSWCTQQAVWERPGNPVSPCGCHELIGYYWHG